VLYLQKINFIYLLVVFKTTAFLVVIQLDYSQCLLQVKFRTFSLTLGGS